MSMLFHKKQLMSMKTRARSSGLNWIDMSTAEAENLQEVPIGSVEN